MQYFVRTVLSIFIAALVSSPAQAADPKASRFYEDALARYEKKDLAGAVIQLKNALQLDKNMLAAQLLMGKVSLANGELPAAEAAFEEALRLGVNRAEIVVPLGQVYLLQGKNETLLDRITTVDLPPALQSDVLVMRSSAQSARGNQSTAEKMLEEARSVNPDSIGARVAQAMFFFRKGDIARATTISDEALKLAPKDPNVWNMQAALAHVRGNLPGALGSYTKAIDLNPQFVDARIARAGIYLDLKKTEEAIRDLDALDEVAPGEPRAAYLRSLIAAGRGDFDAAKKYLSQVVDLLDPVPAAVLGANRQMLFLAGLAHYGLHNHEKATGYLTAYVRQFPGDPAATKILASMYLEQGNSTQVVTLLEPLLRANPNDPRALSLLGNAYMQERNFRKASELLDRAVKLVGGESEFRTDLGLSLIGTGKMDGGLDQLQAAFTKDPRQTRAALALATMHLRSKNSKRAQEVIEKLLKADAENLTAINLLGLAKFANGDRAGARRAYELVLSKDPGDQSAALNIARLDLAENKIDAAKQRLGKLLLANSSSVEAMIELALIEEKAGNQTEAIRWLEKARDDPRGTTVASNMLIEMLLRIGNRDRALNVAKETVSKYPENLSALANLARVQLAGGDRRLARQTLADMARYANYNADAQLEVARLQVAAGNDSGAVYSLEKALSSKPDFLPALVLGTEIEIRAKEYAKADQKIKAIGEKFPSSSASARLAGDLAMVRNQPVSALSHYAAASRLDNSAEIALRAFSAHVAMGNSGKGLDLLERWHREHPTNTQVLRTLADSYTGTGNLSAAKGAIERLLKLRPNDPMVLNNMAIVALRQKDKSALSYAEQAFKLAPNDANIVDTLGWILVRQGELDRGIAHLRDARLRAPGNPEIHFHLASALSQSGRKAEAREELRLALGDGTTFEGIDEARRLNAELSK